MKPQPVSETIFFIDRDSQTRLQNQLRESLAYQDYLVASTPVIREAHAACPDANHRAMRF